MNYVLQGRNIEFCSDTFLYMGVKVELGSFSSDIHVPEAHSAQKPEKRALKCIAWRSKLGQSPSPA